MKPHIVIRRYEYEGFYAVIFSSRAHQALGPGFFSWISDARLTMPALMRHLQTRRAFHV